MLRNTPSYRRERGIDRASRLVGEFERSYGMLAHVTAINTITGGSYRYIYDISEVSISPSPTYATGTKSGGITAKAISVSEIGNSPTYSYGVIGSHIPSGFTPVPIPIGKAVWCVPYRTSDGAELYLIINTQAIDGACP